MSADKTRESLVSFCIFAYNQETVISDAIESAFAQTYKKIEFIISDDASSDGTFNVIQKYVAEHGEGKKIKTIQNKKNLGTALHLDNIVRNHASGNLIVVQAGDDKSLPHRTENILRKWEELKFKPFCISTGLCEMEFDGTMSAVQEKSKPYNDLSVDDFIKKYRGRIGATFAFRREVIDLFGPLMTGNFEDKCIALRAKLLGGYFEMDDVLLLHRKSGISDFQSAVEEQNAIFKVRPLIIEQMINDLKQPVIIQKYSASEIKRFNSLLNRHRTFYVLMKKLSKSKGILKLKYLFKIVINGDSYRLRIWRNRIFNEFRLKSFLNL